MLEKLRQIWYTKQLRKSILYVVGMLFVFRIAAHIPIPAVDVANLEAFFRSNQILGLLNILSGGGIEKFSIVALGVGPYITASIIFQLLAMVIPKLEALSKEGEQGYQRINQYTRIATVPLAVLQGYGLIILLTRSGANIIGNLTPFQWIVTLASMTAGCVFLMWLGELISEKKVGNGISLLIFAGIVAGLPSAFQQTIATFDQTQLVNLIVLVLLGVVTIAGIVLLTQAQRNIPVHYARRATTFGSPRTYLPMRLNQAGMIPIIFAISIILFPPLVAQFFVNAQSVWITQAAQWTIRFFQGQLVYGILYFVLVIAFTYFYTSIIFHPDRVAENLQKQGGFVPGIRPGRATALHLQEVSSHLLLVGSVSLGLIAILPLITQQFLGISTLAIGGAGLLIVVGVVLEIAQQIEAQLVMHRYDYS
ncbi:MAG: preprotein translocase subunit SecY [bacterium]|nr:preprotein translocase subunit SecY [bacterium]